MNILQVLQSRFSAALIGIAADPARWLDMIRPSADPKFGDYQANFAMPLGAQLQRPSREIANEVVARLQVDDLCDAPEIAGPGFINLRLKHDWLSARLESAVGEERLGVAAAANPRTYVVDFSAPNVAKPMHVGHIRSTVIGAALVRTLRFLGHRVISDNHIGDWGTQFGMIIYGYKNFRDEAAYRASPVAELGRLYRLVNRLVDYHAAQATILGLRDQIAAQAATVAQLSSAQPAAAPGDASGKTAKEQEKAAKEAAKTLRRAETQLRELQSELADLEKKRAAIDADPELARLAAEHSDIGRRVLTETARLHAGDPQNLELWREFLPPCLVEIERLYRRLHVSFDHTLGESFYHDALGEVVAELMARGIAKESDGAICVFLPGSPTPLIIRKQDGAFLYATTDLATIQYRVREWSPDAILYVVDHRQSLHFEQLFATARLWGFEKLELKHVSFGTVLGDDGRPFKTRSGDTVGLDSLLDEAVRRARAVVAQIDDARAERELSDDDRDRIAEVVGIGALEIRRPLAKSHQRLCL